MGIQERQNFSLGNFGTFEASTNESLAVLLTNYVDRDGKIFYVVLELFPEKILFTEKKFS